MLWLATLIPPDGKICQQFLSPKMYLRLQTKPIWTTKQVNNILIMYLKITFLKSTKNINYGMLLDGETSF